MSSRDHLTARVDRLESDHRALLIAFGAAFVVLIGVFGAGYLAISGQLNSGFNASAERDAATTASIAALRTDVAVLKERSDRANPPTRGAPQLD